MISVCFFVFFGEGGKYEVWFVFFLEMGFGCGGLMALNFQFFF